MVTGGVRPGDGRRGRGRGAGDGVSRCLAAAASRSSATRALIAVDVDLGDRGGSDAKRATRAANFAALTTAARLLRLKGEGGLVVIDLAGRGHDGPALLSGRAPRVRPGQSRRRVRSDQPLRDAGADRPAPPPLDRRAAAGRGRPAHRRRRWPCAWCARIEREAGADPGARLEARAAPDVVRGRAALSEGR